MNFDALHDAELADVLVRDATTAGCAAPVLNPFSTPVVNAQLSTVDFDGTPTQTADGLEVFFKSTRAGGAGDQDIWTSRRATATATWPPPTNVAELNTSAFDGSPEVSADGMTLWFSSARAGGVGAEDVWTAKRPTRLSPWGTPDRVPELSSASIDEGVMVLPSELVLYLTSDRTGEPSIYRSARAATDAAWSTPVLVPDLPVASNENPWVSADDCALYFSSRVSGGLGGGDLYVVNRSTPGGAFTAPVALTELSSVGDDQDVVLSADQQHVMFASDRDAATSWNLLEATR